MAEEKRMKLYTYTLPGYADRIIAGVVEVKETSKMLKSVDGKLIPGVWTAQVDKSPMPRLSDSTLLSLEPISEDKVREELAAPLLKKRQYLDEKIEKIKTLPFEAAPIVERF